MIGNNILRFLIIKVILLVCLMEVDRPDSKYLMFCHVKVQLHYSSISISDFVKYPLIHLSFIKVCDTNLKWLRSNPLIVQPFHLITAVLFLSTRLSKLSVSLFLPSFTKRSAESLFMLSEWPLILISQLNSILLTKSFHSEFSIFVSL